MRQRLIGIVTLAVVVLGATTMFAHEQIRIVGTITKRDQTTLTVKSVEGMTVSMVLTPKTLVYRNRKKVAVADLKSGLTVVVDTLSYSPDWWVDLEAVEIRIVPAIKPSAGK